MNVCLSHGQLANSEKKSNFNSHSGWS